MGNGGGGGGRGGGGGGRLSGDYKVSLDSRGRVHIAGYVVGHGGPGVRPALRGTSPSAEQLRTARSLIRSAEQRIITESAISGLMQSSRMTRADAINVLHTNVADEVARQMNRR